MSSNFWREEHNLVPCELHVQRHSIITAIGNYPANNPQDAVRALAIAPIAATFETIATIDSGSIVGM